jgi:hypothetical protein
MTREKLSDREKIEQGQLLVRTIIEILGSPKEHIMQTIKDYVKALKNDSRMEIIKEHYADAEEQKDKFYSTYAELEIWFKDTEKLVAFCFDSLPSSIEIIEPETLRIQSTRLSGLLNDLQAKLHRVDTTLKKLLTDQTVGSEKFRQVVNNFIMYSISKGNNTADLISNVVGVDKEKTEKWINEMVEKKIINKKDNIYSI